jgi:hypothetical protein
MALPLSTLERPASRGLYCSQDLAVPSPTAFELICEVEKWPVWLSFLRSARRVEADLPLTVGSEVAIRSMIPGEEEELFEVDQFIDGHVLSLVGAYSVRRRFDLRVESKTTRSKLVMRVDYPTYGGVVGALIDRLTMRRKLEGALTDSLVHFKGLVEFERAPDALLEDF